MEAVNLAEMVSKVNGDGSPKIVGELNDSYVKAVKLRGEFIWHHHDNQDEFFLIIKRRLKRRSRDSEVIVSPGECIIMPQGVEHLPSAQQEVHIVRFEPKTTLNTGHVQNERTVLELERI
jgi:mannose-6-phosphate isomerase-like protein (cupin superfamily)